MARFWRGYGCAVGLTVLAFVPAARAQGVGIQVDRDSPSGTEYQLPLERARQDAQPGGPPLQVRPGERTAPAFGEGIKAPSASGTAPQNEGLDPSSGTTRRDARKRTADGGSTHAGTVTAPAALPPPSSSKPADGPGSSLLGVGGIAAGVLALGASVGLLLRRRARPGPGAPPRY